MKSLFKQLLRTGALLHMTTPALAHDGHGLPGASHWHAIDTWGFVGMAVALVVSIWLSHGGKP